MLTPGEILRNKRKSLGKTIFEVSQETRILEKYIKQIEANEFHLFDSEVFARGFVKIYAQYLELDENTILALFRRENKSVPKGKSKKVGILTGLKDSNLTKSILIGVTTALFLAFAGYIYYQLYQYQLQPQLTVFTPLNGSIVKNETLKIEGVVSKNAKLLINDTEISNINGTFNHELTILEGENTVAIKAINQRNSSKIEERIVKVFYEKDILVKPNEEDILKSFNLEVRTKGESVWLKILVDGKQKFAQIASPNFSLKETVTKQFEVVSGRPEITEVYINKKKRELVKDIESGVASISCKIENNEIICLE